jgi:hydrogenase small subunit
LGTIPRIFDLKKGGKFMPNVSRRDFLKYCGIGAGALGLSMSDLGRLEKAFADPNGPSVIWLQGSACSGCSESLLNRISTSSPKNAASVLIDVINLAYHPNLMAAAGQEAVKSAKAAYDRGGYILAVEGGIPTAYGGNACWAWTFNNVEVTFQNVVKDLASKAAAILCIGTCASWGGIPAAPPNPAGIVGVKALTGKTTINIAGCPPHPDWMVWGVVQVLLKKPVSLDGYGRPTALFSKTVHSQCPRRETGEVNTFGVDNRCLKELGCRGPETRGNCPIDKWNNKVNWCIDANAPCIGCTEPTFPGTKGFYQEN